MIYAGTIISEKSFGGGARYLGGKTMSYGEVAKMAGNPNAARAVGNILKTNYNRDIPYHRVIRSDG